VRPSSSIALLTAIEITAARTISEPIQARAPGRRDTGGPDSPCRSTNVTPNDDACDDAQVGCIAAAQRPVHRVGFGQVILR
jgi:hypothetical protein